MGREARLIFALNACVQSDAYVLDNPPRAIVDLPEVNFQIDPREGLAKPRGRRRGRAAGARTRLIGSFRFGRLSAGKSRIVVDLSRPAEIRSVVCAPTKTAGVFELKLTLAPESGAAFRAAARAGVAKEARAIKSEAPTPALPPNDDHKPIVVLDPGHGGIDSGALGPDHIEEKNIVLAFAKVLGAKLRAEHRYRIVFTRTDDTFVPLTQRVRIAQKIGAALFVSIHADTLPGGGARGATVYTLSDRASDAEAARVAQSENEADSAAGVEDKQDYSSDVSDILFELTRRETHVFSNIFARVLANHLKIVAPLNKNPERSAAFVVLKDPDVTSVLLELGYLSNAKDASNLTSPKWREKAATEVAHAIDAYFALNRPADKTAAPTEEGALKATQRIGN